MNFLKLLVPSLVITIASIFAIEKIVAQIGGDIRDANLFLFFSHLGCLLIFAWALFVLARFLEQALIAEFHS